MEKPAIETYYSHSNEKPVLKALLKQLLEGQEFRRALDVGAGRGFLSQTLKDHSEELCLIEKNPYYESLLRESFPQAQLIIGNAEEVLLPDSELILASHILYYLPVERWPSFIEHLYRSLRRNGSLMMVMNRERGDWWKIVKAFDEVFPAYKSFHYRPWGRFIEELERKGYRLEQHLSRYSLQFPDLESMVEYHIKSCLSVREPALQEKVRSWVRQYCEKLVQGQGLNLYYEQSLLRIFG